MGKDNREKVVNGLYIPSIEACWLYTYNQETENYEVDDKYLDKLLKGKIDFSFELVENLELVDGIEIKEKDGKYYTLDIVNIKYTKQYKKVIGGLLIEQKSTKELREWSYNNGFQFNNCLLTNWKRGSGKAREGEDLFLVDKLKNKCLDWARMGLKFEGEVDIAGVRAYESLPLSSIIGCIPINPKNILVIKDFESKFPWVMSKTWLQDKELHTNTEEVQECNSIWDGQGLLSKKIFDENDLIKGHGVALLRNRYMKCAGFCCDIEKFFRDYCDRKGLDYNTYEIEDIDGNRLAVNSIELITTPSSIKIEKFNDKVCEKEGYSGKGAWLQYFKDNCGNNFGVCKVDKPSYRCKKNSEGNIVSYRQVLSYQMINTIPFEDEEKIKKLVKSEITHVNKLKNDLDYFLKEVAEERLNTEKIVDDDEIDFVIGSNIDVMGAFLELSRKNPGFENTQVFKDYRRNYINAYVNRLRAGKILVDGTDYSIACGNPYEMLLATVGEFDGKTSVINGNELCCTRFEDGEEVVGFRNPSINTGNIGFHVNKKSKEILDYMSNNSTIVYLNSINYPTLSTYQGEDFDIDSNLLTNNQMIVEACKKIDKDKATPIPFNDIKALGDNKNILDSKNMSDIDHIISQNYIGEVINLSQELNSLLNHLKYNNLASEEELENIYKMTSRLSSISQCEIDKAKRQFDELKIKKEIDKITKNLKRVEEDNIIEITKEIAKLKAEFSVLRSKIKLERKEKRKPINSEIAKLRKCIKDEKMDQDYEQLLVEKKSEIKVVNLEREDELIELRCKINNKKLELNKYDNRRMKPYFFKFAGDKEVQNKRKKNNKAHRDKLDEPIIEQYCLENNILISELDRKNKPKDLNLLLKVNDDIQKEWEDAIYYKNMDTPMDWLQIALNGIEPKNKKGTRQVIQLVKKNTNKTDPKKVEKVIEIINDLDSKIKAHRLNYDIDSKDRLAKIRAEKEIASKKIKSKNLKQADIYRVLRESLNTVKNNGKLKKRSGIESISLEILFKTYGTGLLKMFC